MSETMGWEEKIGIDSASSTVTTQFGGFATNTFTKTRPLIQPQGGDGNIDPLYTRARYGVSTIQGSIRLEPTLGELAVLLPWIYGATNTGTDFPLGQTFVGYYMSIDKKQKVFDYTGVKVASAIFECLPNQPMSLTLNLLALTETVSNAGTFPSLTPDYTRAYPILTDGVFTVNSVTTCSELFRLTIDNGMTYAPFTNCQTGPAAIIAVERTITVEFLPGYNGDHSALYPPSESGWSVSVVFTPATVSTTSLTWSLGKVVFEHQAPSAASARDFMKLPLRGRALRQNATASLVTTLDSTV